MRTRRRRPVRKRVLVALLIFILLLVGVGLLKAGQYLPVVWDFFSKKEITLKHTTQDKDIKINVLLLGVGGGMHDGPDLTDTIIFASVDPTTKKVVLVSLPRDLWSPELKAKINSAYTYAEDQKTGSGLGFTKSMISNILGQQIDYAVKIDFSGFEKAVDLSGGLDISVDNTFDDYAYPIAGKEADSCGLSDDKIADLASQIASGSAAENESFPCRYEHLHFDKGSTHMNGETALKYVRSRHGTGKEGSDFARSKRQEKVLSAFKEKIFSAGTLLNPVKVVDLLTILKASIATDIKQSEYSDFARLAQKMKGAQISSAVVDTGDESEGRLGLLVNPPISPEYGNQWVLSPRLGNGEYKEIQTYVACKVKGSNCVVGENGIVTPTPIPSPIITGSKKKSN